MDNKCELIKLIKKHKRVYKELGNEMLLGIVDGIEFLLDSLAVSDQEKGLPKSNLYEMLTLLKPSTEGKSCDYVKAYNCYVQHVWLNLNAGMLSSKGLSMLVTYCFKHAIIDLTGIDLPDTRGLFNEK